MPEKPTTLKISQETLGILREAKPDGMSNSLFIRRTIEEKGRLEAKVAELEKELAQERMMLVKLILAEKGALKNDVDAS